MIVRKQDHTAGGGMFTAWKGFPFFLIIGFFILGQIPAPAFSGEAVTFPQAL
jgi:hypothetical protein